MAVDGGPLVESVMDGLGTVLGVERRADGPTVWLAEFDGDTIGPSSGSSGTYNQLLETGFEGETGIDVKGVVVGDAGGRLASITFELGPWWQVAIEEASGTHPDTLTVSAVLTIPELTEPLVVEAPCANPETEEANGPHHLLVSVSPIEI